MKIKKFRIKPRLPSVGRILKALLNVKQLPDGVEESLPEESAAFLTHVTPTAFSQTWSYEESPPPIRAVLSQAGMSKSVAVSAVIATVGPQVEEHLSGLLMNGETQKAQIITAFAEESADLSLQFILRLLTEEALEDACDILEPLPVEDPALLSETLTLLEASTEDVVLDAAGHLTPRFTRVILAAWWPLSKKKRPVVALPAKKKSF